MWCEINMSWYAGLGLIAPLMNFKYIYVETYNFISRAMVTIFNHNNYIFYKSKYITYQNVIFMILTYFRTFRTYQNDI